MYTNYCYPIVFVLYSIHIFDSSTIIAKSITILFGGQFMIPKPQHQKVMLDPVFPFECEEIHADVHNNLIFCHWHPYIEIIYIEQGTVKMRLDNQTYQLSEGDICIVNPNQVHYGVSESGLNCSVKYIVLSYDILGLNSNSISHKKYLESLIDSRLLLPSIIPHFDKRKHDTPIWHSECHSIIRMLLQLGSKDYEGKELAIQGALLMLLSILYQYDLLIETPSTHSSAVSDRELAILHYIESHFTESIKVPFLASKFMVSEDYFYKLFKQSTGVTPVRYIQQLRISYAKQLLRTTSLSVSSIGYQVGFDSSSYFAKNL